MISSGESCWVIAPPSAPLLHMVTASSSPKAAFFRHRVQHGEPPAADSTALPAVCVREFHLIYPFVTKELLPVSCSSEPSYRSLHIITRRRLGVFVTGADARVWLDGSCLRHKGSWLLTESGGRDGNSWRRAYARPFHGCVQPSRLQHQRNQQGDTMLRLTGRLVSS